MPSDRPQSESSCESILRENEALKKRLEWFSRQLYGRVMPGLYTPIASATDDDLSDEDGIEPENAGFRSDGGADGDRPLGFRESSAAYRVEVPTSIPPDFPSEDVTLELPEKEVRGMCVIGFERAEAIAMRPAVVMRRIRRSMYVSSDGSGFASAALAPALFPDPSGGPLVFDASFVAAVTASRMSGVSFRAISRRMKRENELEISAESLRRLVQFAAETLSPLGTALVVRTLPDWMNLHRLIEEAKTGGDWFADEFLQKIHALRELEEHARIRAERLGGAPEDLYRERRAARANSARMTTSFFDLCRETLPVLKEDSPLAETLRYALEHESFLSCYLHDPRMEFSRANPELPISDPFAALAVCADECRARGIAFRSWLEHALVMLKQPNPPPPESLFPG